ncbi:Class II Aldolase and Adducin N-terminal domain-containing protein [Cryobacterium flavum]|uniref:Class II aldolase n=1 Tax=Cryobacterium flavum TaxID=1424659 RepID=A0A4R8VHU5_9MICO|nr:MULTISPECIES: class II aldolase/adducin family protein [Cryobacterium]TFB82268.1 class II aldolase [Cryobacterium flavum]TFD08162.1 class II aldolase [Cryobacterium sp. TMT1-66-1]TFD12211.1 class II aldolase [Cryobacterium sp. TMT1-2-2]SDN94685.1 Class II Aldolase and Adducin N-terminal domain-containing protein [Cryobacterium flavum]
MVTIWQPELVTDDLVALTHSLGEPAKDLVILAEGNTSQRLADGRIVVKASGAYMSAVTRDDFVVTDVQPLIDLMDDATSTQEDLTEMLDAGEHTGTRRRASIETLVHVAVQSVQPTAYVAHTHPTSVLGLLASVHAESAFAQWVYSDEAVVIGTPLFVPYAAPGIALGRLFLQRLRDYVATRGELPSVVLLGNHGIVAIGGSAEAVEAITLMTVKGARTRVQALSIGGVIGLGDDTVAHYFERTDMAERRKNLAGTA